MNPEGSRNVDGNRGGATNLGDKLARGGRQISGGRWRPQVAGGGRNIAAKGNRRPDDWLGEHFSGLGSRQSGAGFRCSGTGTGSGPEFYPAPAPVPDNPYQGPEGRDLGPEIVSPLANRPTDQLVN